MNPGEAAIQGTVTDRNGAAVPNARITATNTETGVQLTRETSSTGGFRIGQLAPGNYNIEASAKGFQRLLEENVRVAPFELAGLNLKLNVGADNTTITITDAPAALDTTNARLGGTIENELYTNLPLSMGGAPRDPAAFQYTSPGVQEGRPTQRAPQQQASSGGPQQGLPPSSSGGLQQGVYGGTGQTNLNENYIEGIPVSNISSAPAAAPAAGAAAPAATTAGQPAKVTTAPAAARVIAAPVPAAPPPPPPPQPGPVSNAQYVAGAAVSKVQSQGDNSRVAKAVSVDAISSLAADTAAVAAKARPVLPSHLAALAVVSNAGQTLALDAAGTLFLSADAGVTWRPIVAQWTGRVTALRLTQAPKTAQALASAKVAKVAAQYEITTASGAIFTSGDGLAWQRK
jgi:hypothetical protein